MSDRRSSRTENPLILSVPNSSDVETNANLRTDATSDHEMNVVGSNEEAERKPLTGGEVCVNAFRSIKQFRF